MSFMAAPPILFLSTHACMYVLEHFFGLSVGPAGLSFRALVRLAEDRATRGRCSPGLVLIPAALPEPEVGLSVGERFRRDPGAGAARGAGAP